MASQPPKETAYSAGGNPVTSNPAENYGARMQAGNSPGREMEERGPTTQEGKGLPSALAHGVRGAGAGEERFGRTEEQLGRHRELEGEQMRAPGEGEVADAVKRKPGAGNYEPDLASDLDRKKAEQAEARESTRAARQHGIDVDGGSNSGNNPRGGMDM